MMRGNSYGGVAVAAVFCMAPMHVGAQEEGFAIDEVVVTAQKRTERLVDAGRHFRVQRELHRADGRT